MYNSSDFYFENSSKVCLYISQFSELQEKKSKLRDKKSQLTNIFLSHDRNSLVPKPCIKTKPIKPKNIFL